MVKEKDKVEGSMVEAANGPKLLLSKEHTKISGEMNLTVCASKASDRRE